MNVEISAAILRWQEATRVLRAAIAEENQARLALVGLAFPAPLEGVNNQPLGNGWILQGTFRNNYSLDNKRVEAQMKLLPAAVARGLVSWDAKLKVGAYKALEPAHKNVVNEVLTIKPGMPALEIVEPKRQDI